MTEEMCGYTRQDYLWTWTDTGLMYLQVIKAFEERGVVWVVLEVAPTALILRPEGATSRVKELCKR